MRVKNSRVLLCHIKELTPDIKEHLYTRLSRPDGIMKELLASYPETYVCIVKNRNRPIGWSALDKNPWYPEAQIHVFVDTKYRKKGLGVFLIRKLLKSYSGNVKSLCYWGPADRFYRAALKPFAEQYKARAFY